ncbi:MAG TPA: hypothetical protein VGY13_09605 [Solirubrobacteraceae bacterium]|jgi:hypothetical protein|nr:hypothetical protein [Solirubrobacteraceae bacterium]
MGELISQELAATIASLNAPERRHARRLVRRGEPAEDVLVARYAVAYARERRRRLERSSFTFGLALGAASGLAGIGLAIYFLSRAADARAAVLAALGAVLVASSWRTWQAAINVEAAEQANREYLRRSGAPYVPGGPPTRVDVPPLALAGSLAIHVAAIFVVGGAVTLALREAPLTLGRVLSVGASGGAGAAIGAVIGVIHKRRARPLP